MLRCVDLSRDAAALLQVLRDGLVVQSFIVLIFGNSDGEPNCSVSGALNRKLVCIVKGIREMTIYTFIQT